jgi:hypothetical protein
MTLERLDPIHQTSLSILRLSWLPIPGDPAVAKLYVLLCMLLLTQAATAQTPVSTSTPAPWPPDANAIFAEGVQWEVVPPTPEPPTETPFIYPTYDPDPPMVCNGAALQPVPGEGRWVVAYQGNHDRPGYLCNTETEEEHHGLPPDEQGYLDWGVYPTPDTTKLLLRLGFEIFVYDLEDESYIKLGDAVVYSYSDINFCRWITDTQGVLCSQERDGNSHYPEEYFVFDITKLDSVTPAFLGWDTDTFYEENLNRYVSIYSNIYRRPISGDAGPREHIPCHVTVYDAQGLRQKELGYNCLPVFDEYSATPFYRYGNYLYYIVVDEDETKPTSLYRYSIVDETITEISHLEVKNIIGISPDEQYIVVITDTDLDRQPISEGASEYYFGAESWQVAIIEIETGYIMYKTDDLGVYMPDQLIWADDTTLLLDALWSSSENGSESGYVFPSIWRIELPEKDDPVGTVKVLTMPISESGLRLLSPNAVYGSIEYGNLIDLRTFDLIPLLQNVPLPFQNSRPPYELDFEWESDHSLLIEVSPRDDDQPSITYRVILP